MTDITSKPKPNTFMAAMKDFFGLRPGQTLMEFRDEIKELSADDRAYFATGLRANGYPIPTETAAAA